MRAFEHLPIIKALKAFARDKVRAPVSVQVPFADAARVVAFGLQNLGDGGRAGIERNVIEENAVRQWPLSGQQRRARGRTDRQTGDGVNESETLRREPVEVRRFDVRIAYESERLRPPLVGQHDENVRLAFGGVERSGERHQQRQDDEATHAFGKKVENRSSRFPSLGSF
jgi:hypothetical protein